MDEIEELRGEMQSEQQEKDLEELRKRIDGIIRRWLPGQSYGYNEAVNEIMDAIDRDL